MKKKIFWILVALVVLGLIMWKFVAMRQNKSSSGSTCGHNHSHGHGHSHGHDHGQSGNGVVAMSPNEMRANGIRLQKAQPGTLSMTFSSRGKIVLHPDCLAHVLPKVSGVVKEVKKNIGDEVKRGDILAVIESHDMADIKAGYLAALEKVKLSSSLFEREKRLYEKKISAEQDYLSAMSANEEAKINVQLAKQKLKSFGLDDEEMFLLADHQEPELNLYEIRSPIDGTVIQRHAIRGELVDNTTNIFEVAAVCKVWVEIAVYPKDIMSVEKGQTAHIKFPISGKEAEAKIIFVSPIIQDETITSVAIAEMGNPGAEWQPGTFVQANIATENTDVSLLIPKEALLEIGGKNVVFARVAGGFEKREVEVGRSDNQNIEVVSGLNQGDVYAASNTYLLKADLGKHEVEHEH